MPLSLIHLGRGVLTARGGLFCQSGIERPEGRLPLASELALVRDINTTPEIEGTFAESLVPVGE